MKKKTPFCLILDGRNAWDINELMSQNDLLNLSGVLPLAPIETEELFKAYINLSDIIAKDLVKDKQDAQHVTITDLKAGIGNALELMAMCIIEDARFPGIHNNSINLLGFEHEPQAVAIADPLLKRITPNVEMRNIGFASEDPLVVFQAITETNVEPGNVNIIICPDFFEDEGYNSMMEEELFDSIPIGTYVYLPGEVKNKYNSAIFGFSRKLFRKERADVTVIK